MKNLKVLFATMAVAMFTFLSVNDAKAQTTNIGTLVGGLVTLNIQDIDLEEVQVVNVENVTIDISENDISILERVSVQNVRINALNNLLREADFLNDNQVVIGVLSSGEFLISNL